VRLALAICVAALVAPASALAAGGPVPPVQGGSGVTVPGDAGRYVALAAGRDTLVVRIRTGSGIVDGTRRLRGSFGVAGVGYDGSTTGLSADGHTLVLPSATVAYPPRRTELAVLDAPGLRPRTRIVLDGSYTVDALSPDGRWLYLIRYLAVDDPLRYEVRVYDMRQRRLLPRAIVDPREPDEAMAGIPMTRATSTDGRWAYTLYQRTEGEPFIHALDTAGRTARCIDLPTLEGSDVSGDRLSVDGGRLVVESAAGPQAIIDRTTFAVSRPAPAAAPVPATVPAPAPERGGDSPWVLALLPLAALLAAAVTVRRRRARS
jgi:hypothetical protein